MILILKWLQKSGITEMHNFVRTEKKLYPDKICLVLAKKIFGGKFKICFSKKTPKIYSIWHGCWPPCYHHCYISLHCWSSHNDTSNFCNFCPKGTPNIFWNMRSIYSEKRKWTWMDWLFEIRNQWLQKRNYQIQVCYSQIVREITQKFWKSNCLGIYFFLTSTVTSMNPS